MFLGDEIAGSSWVGSAAVGRCLKFPLLGVGDGRRGSWGTGGPQPYEIIGVGGGGGRLRQAVNSSGVGAQGKGAEVGSVTATYAV